jgi:autotransporter family porin
MARFYPARRILPSMLAPFRPVRRTAIAPNRPAVTSELLQPRGPKSALVGARRGGRTGNALRTLLLETVASVALLCLSDQSALAACHETPPGSGTFDCEGQINEGFTSTGQSVTVTAHPNANFNDDVSIAGPGTSTFNNEGTVNADFIAEDNDSFTLNNNGTLQNGFIGSGDGIIIFNHNGVINSGGITITGNGENRLNIFAGRTVNGLADITGASNFVDSQGTFNAGLTMTGTELNSVIIRAGGAVSGTFSLTGPRNFIDNFGTFNSGITLTGDGLNLVVNREAGVMQGVTSDGSARDFFFNNGRINQTVTLGDGDDVFINRNILANVLDMGAGDDVFDMADGTINGNVLLGSGEDQAFIRNGDITNTVQGQDGNDHVVWTGGTIIGLDTGADTDFAHFIGLTPNNLKTGLPVNGGLGADDVLLWTNTVGGDVARYDNWEQFELTDNSELTFDNFATLTLGDSGTGTGTLAIDETSTVFAGNGTHTVASFASGQLVAVHNWGTIDLTNNNTNATDRFVVGRLYRP